MTKNIHKNIKYLQTFIVHFMIFIIGLMILIWLGNYLFQQIPWVKIILYLWGIMLVLHAILIFGLMGLFGNKFENISIRVKNIIIYRKA